jgi:hypothetical protein
MEPNRPARTEKGNIAMRVECPRCRHTQEMPGHLAGQAVSCLACGHEWHTGPKIPRNNDAQNSLMLSILGLVLLLGPLAQIPAIYFGHRHLKRAGRDAEVSGGRRTAIASLILGYAGIVVWTALAVQGVRIFFFYMSLLACTLNLQQHGLACRDYAKDHDGMWPLMSAEPGRLMYAMEEREGLPSVYPAYLQLPELLACPKQPGPIPADEKDKFNDQSYFYINYAITGDESAEALAEAYLAAVARGVPLSGDISVGEGRGTAGSDTLYKLRENVWELLPPDPENPRYAYMYQDTIPVMIERLGNHRDKANVLYMSGRVSSIPYPGKFPMTERTIAALESMDQAQAP